MELILYEWRVTSGEYLQSKIYNLVLLRADILIVADLFVEGKVLVELKADKEYNSRHEAQLLNYLKEGTQKMI